MLGRIPDVRVRQFWDPKHVVARSLNELAKRRPPEPEPYCCMQKGFYWDEAILYLPGAHWQDAASTFWNGPVARVIPGLEKSLSQQPVN